MARYYYRLAHGTKPLELADGFPWPYAIDLCFDPIPYPIAFSEGVAHGAAGCVASASEALDLKWRDFFQITKGEWLLPYIELLAQHISLEEELVLAHYERIHGKSPERCPTG